jgi:hypothetical protein
MLTRVFRHAARTGRRGIVAHSDETGSDSGPPSPSLTSSLRPFRHLKVARLDGDTWPLWLQRFDSAAPGRLDVAPPAQVRHLEPAGGRTDTRDDGSTASR